MKTSLHIIRNLPDRPWLNLRARCGFGSRGMERRLQETSFTSTPLKVVIPQHLSSVHCANSSPISLVSNLANVRYFIFNSNVCYRKRERPTKTYTLPYGQHTRGYFYLPHADLTGLDQYRVQRSAHVRDQVPKICAGNETLALIVSCKHGGISSFYFTLRKIPKQKLDWKSVCVRGLQDWQSFRTRKLAIT